MTEKTLYKGDYETVSCLIEQMAPAPSNRKMVGYILNGGKFRSMYQSVTRSETETMLDRKYIKREFDFDIPGEFDFDTDGDGISDEEEELIGLLPYIADCDHDGMIDGLELQYGFDPYEMDFDQDGHLDFQEYIDGTDPYVYNKDWDEYCVEFVAGFILAGLLPAAGDLAKGAGVTIKFIGSNVSEIAKVSDLMIFVSAKFPDMMPLFKNSDEVVETIRQATRLDGSHLTKAQLKTLTNTADAVLHQDYVIKTGTKLGDIRYYQNIPADVWDNGWATRGKLIDEAINHHKQGIGLGEYFPVADRVEGRVLVSKKSLDLMAPSYTKTSNIENTLNRAADQLKKIENRFDADGELTRADRTLKLTDYDTKALEVVLPNTCVDDRVIKCLNAFKEKMKKEGIDVWYCVTN